MKSRNLSISAPVLLYRWPIAFSIQVFAKGLELLNRTLLLHIFGVYVFTNEGLLYKMVNKLVEGNYLSYGYVIFVHLIFKGNKPDAQQGCKQL